MILQIDSPQRFSLASFIPTHLSANGRLESSRYMLVGKKIRSSWIWT